MSSKNVYVELFTKLTNTCEQIKSFVQSHPPEEMRAKRDENIHIVNDYNPPDDQFFYDERYKRLTVPAYCEKIYEEGIGLYDKYWQILNNIHRLKTDMHRMHKLNLNDALRGIEISSLHYIDSDSKHDSISLIPEIPLELIGVVYKKPFNRLFDYENPIGLEYDRNHGMYVYFTRHLLNYIDSVIDMIAQFFRNLNDLAYQTLEDLENAKEMVCSISEFNTNEYL